MGIRGYSGYRPPHRQKTILVGRYKRPGHIQPDGKPEFADKTDYRPAGDVIEIRSQGVYRNGELLDEPYLAEKFVYNKEERYEVPEGHVFVLATTETTAWTAGP